MSKMDDFGFWDGLLREAYVGSADDSVNMFLHDAVETRMHSKSLAESFDKLRGLTDNGRDKLSLELPVEKGTRVAFKSNLGLVLTSTDIPDNGIQGTVTTVRSAAGDVTAHDGNVFVEWDDNKFRAIHHTQLTRVSPTSKKSTMRVSSLGDLTDFLKVSKDVLVHKSTQDIWSFKKEGEDYIIERLLGEDDKPLKI